MNMFATFSRLISAGVLVSGLWLTGCAVTSQVEMKGELYATTELQPEDGFVTLRVINATSKSAPINFITLVPDNVNESEEVKPVRMEAILAAAEGSSMFLSAVPAGRYSVRNLRAFHYNYNYSYDDWIQVATEIGVFTVEPGETTDLGSLIYLHQPQGDSYKRTVIRAPFRENRAELKALKPFFDYPGNATTWDEDDREELRWNAYVSTVQNPSAFNDIYEASNGDVYFIGKLGYILVRHVNGSWSSDAADVDTDLFAIARSPGGRLLVGGEFGVLLAKNGSEDEWYPLNIDRTLRVEKIAFLDDNIADVVAWSQDEVQVLRVELGAGSADMKMRAQLRANRGWYNPAGELIHEIFDPSNSLSTIKRRVAYVSTSRIGDQHTISVGIRDGAESSFSILDKPRRFMFDYDPATWQLSEGEGFGDGVDAVVDAGAVMLGINMPGIWSWTGRPTYLRYDSQSEDWLKVKTYVDNCPGLPPKARACEVNGERLTRQENFAFQGTPVFFDENEAFAVAQYRRSSGDEPQLKLLKTSDGGTVWHVASHEVPGKYCSGTVPQVTDGLLISCSGISSDFYFSADKGETWEHTRQHENF